MNLQARAAIDRVAKAAYNALMADSYDDLPVDGIEREAWRQVAVASINEIERMYEEWRISREV